MKRGPSPADVDRFYMALARLLRNYQFRDRDRQTICGISVTQCYALDFLVHEKRLTVFQLAEKLALNKGNASRAVAALEEMGAVSRVRDPANHRVHWIEATARGRQLRDRITEDLKRVYARRLQPYGAPFVRRVAGLLDELAGLAHQ
jgi:MarR family transcriptional regulator, 2-MHQ and catechol-resistance regulon repressor